MFSSFKAWINEPFQGTLSIWNYTLIIGLILVLIILWSRVISLLEGITETVTSAV